MIKRKILTLIFYGMFLSIFVVLGIILCALASWNRDATENSKLLAEVQTYTESTTSVVSNSENVSQDAPPYLTVDFEKLLKRYEDVDGWLRITLADIDMPIVQTTDNEFYLDHDLDKRPNELGWVFASASSNVQYLGANTVLYGHNLSNKKMFGSLKGLLTLLNEQPDAGIIQLTTPTHEMVFQIRSIYFTDVSDMLYTGTGGQLSWRTSFVEHMHEKNQVKALTNDQMTALDQYLTLSTCYQGQAND